MYNRFFGFKERPFKLVPNPAYLYLSQVHQEVLAHLNYAVGYGDGFVEITGEVGTGKTTLCRMFLESLDENTEAAYIFNPKLDALQLLKAITDEFGIPSDTASVKDLIDRFNTFLLEKKSQGKRVILLVDEAQNLNADVLEQLRLLSNLETTTSKLLQIILVGQPELGELLESDALRQLNQRITLSCHLTPLSLSETREYIRHRIHIASQKPGPSFSAMAYRSIFKYTGGVPRLINITCDRALLTAYTLGKHHITTRIVKRALHELAGKRRRSRAPLLHREKLIIGLLALVVILVTGLVVGQTSLHRIGLETVAHIVHRKVEKSPSPATPDVSSATVDKKALNAVGQAADRQQPAREAPPVETDAASPPVVTAPPPGQPTTDDIQQVIISLDAPNSRINALTAVLKAWQVPITLDAVPANVRDNDIFFRVSARRSALEALRIQGDLNLIRKLNLPAILEFPRTNGGAMQFVALVGLENNTLRLSDGEAFFSVSPASLAGLWNGVAHVFWKNYYHYQGVVPISSPGETILSLKVHLKKLGFPIAAMTAAYDTTTRLAVEVIQARNGLNVDGMVGPLTKIALFNEDKSLAIPRLTPPRGYPWQIDPTLHSQ